jgi:hypothetical protein
MRSRSSSGQASVEYIAVVALVAIIFAVAGSFTLQGRAIAAATMAQMRRGLCIVEGHDCKDPVEPCSVSSHGSGTDFSATAYVIRLGAGKFALIDRLSNGKATATITHHLDGGIAFDAGRRLKIGGRSAISANVRAAVLASAGYGTIYTVDNETQAEAVVLKLQKPNVDPNFYTPAIREMWRKVDVAMPKIPPPTGRFHKFEGKVSLSGKVLGGDSVLGMSTDEMTGKKTYYLSAGIALDPAGVVHASGTGKIALTVDRNDRPLDLSLVGSGDLNGSMDLPASVQSIAGHVKAGKGRTWELEGHLDLTQPGRPSVWNLVKDPAQLIHLMQNDGYVQFRAYDTSEDGLGLEADGKAFGGGFDYKETKQHLVTALDHTREGFWVPRYDCLEAAA